MPRLFTPHHPQDMPEGRLALRQSRWRLAAVLLALALLPLMALYGTIGPIPGLGPKSHPAMPELPEGFRQLGQTLIGEVRTEDGRRLTLVLDARTRAVIGSRLEDKPVGELPR